MADDTSDLLAAAEHFLHALDDLDWDAFAACWAAEPTAFYPGQEERLEGRAAVLAPFRALFDRTPREPDGPPYLHLHPRDLRVDRYDTTGLVTFLVGEPPAPVALRSLLFVWEHGTWKVAHLHGTHRGVNRPAPTA
jgi:hypothetical protein